ncbi:MAG TPA: glycosyltransferase family 87 protein, partial [Myxococcaceae bacterium]|nr:glycosyltransferase family 87 protein [Myxococcaceae bacterium]
MSPPDAPRVLPGVATCAALLALALVNAAAVRTNDFRVFHTAGARVLAGEALYRSDDGQYPFKYAPVVGLLLAPVGALPLRTAKALWEVASAAALFLFLRHSARLQSPAPTRASGAVAFLLLLPYVWHLFSLGQIDGFLLAAIALSDRWGDRRPVPAGLLWALALLTKPPYLVFLAAALLGRQWPRLLALAGGLAAGLFAPALVWGWGANLAALRAWWGVLGASTPELLCAPSNQSLWAIACRYLGPGLGPALGVATLGTLALVVITVRSAFRARASARDTVTCACLAATALASPLGWWTNLVALAP